MSLAIEKFECDYDYVNDESISILSNILGELDKWLIKNYKLCIIPNKYLINDIEAINEFRDRVGSKEEYKTLYHWYIEIVKYTNKTKDYSDRYYNRKNNIIMCSGVIPLKDYYRTYGTIIQEVGKSWLVKYGNVCNVNYYKDEILMVEDFIKWINEESDIFISYDGKENRSFRKFLLDNNLI